MQQGFNNLQTLLTSYMENSDPALENERVELESEGMEESTSEAMDFFFQTLAEGVKLAHTGGLT